MSEALDTPQDELLQRNTENLSLYSPDEERRKLNEISERAKFPVKFVQIGDGVSLLGYLAIPNSKDRQQEITTEADIHFLDFDDTQAQTSIKKKECWKRVGELGISDEIIKHCDTIARVTFKEEHGAVYEPELDMRLLTYALEHSGDDVAELKQQLDKYRDELLGSRKSFTQLLEEHVVDPQIRQVFDETRFKVDLYPDTTDILRRIRKTESDWNKVNLFLLTYGDSVFQFEKTLPLLEKGAVQAVFLTKAKKGPFLRQVIMQNPFKECDIKRLRSFPGTSDWSGMGIDVTKDGQKIVVTDDDPEQVSSLNELNKELELLIEVRRIVSRDQKRANTPTPEGEQVRVIEISRNKNLYIEQNLEQIHAELFRDTHISDLVRLFQYWLSKHSQTQRVGAIEAIRRFLMDIEADAAKDRAIGRPNHWDPYMGEKWYPEQISDAAIYIRNSYEAKGEKIGYEESISEAQKIFETRATEVYEGTLNTQSS